MPWDRKRLLGYVETIQLILGVTDKFQNLLITIILKGSDFFYQLPLILTALSHVAW